MKVYPINETPDPSSNLIGIVKLDEDFTHVLEDLRTVLGFSYEKTKDGKDIYGFYLTRTPIKEEDQE